MREEAINLLEDEQSRILKALSGLAPGSNDYANALKDLETLSGILSDDRKTRAEASKVMLEHDRLQLDTTVENRKLELADLQQKLEEAKLKEAEKDRWTKLGISGVDLLKAGACVGMAVFANETGLFVSKDGLAMTRKI